MWIFSAITFESHRNATKTHYSCWEYMACLSPTRGTLQISPWLAAFPDDPFTRTSWGSTTINNTERREGCNRCIICIPILGRYAQSTCTHAWIPHDFGVMKRQTPSQCRNETDVVIQEVPPREYSPYFYRHSTCIRRKHHYLGSCLWYCMSSFKLTGMATGTSTRAISSPSFG